MVGVSRVSQSEQDGDDHDDPEVGAVREAGDSVIESEHGGSFVACWLFAGAAAAVRSACQHRSAPRQTTVGLETVMAMPSAMITEGARGGQQADNGPLEAHAVEDALAVTASRPMPVIVAARPTLNATMRRRP